MKGVRIPFVWSPLIVLIVILSLIMPALPATPALAREAVGSLEGRDPVAASASPGVLPAADPARIAAALGELPLYFIENRGQVERPVAYYAQGRDSAIYFTPGGVTFALSASAQRWAVKLDFLDANGDVKPAGQDKTEAIVSYFKGQPDEWQTGLPTYSRVVYPDLWPGIDLVYLGRANELKYEFRVRPGADPARIRLAYHGAEQVSLTAGGALRVDTPAGSLTDTAPVAYQEVDDRQVPVRAAFELTGSEYGFALGAYDPTRPLVIDPAVLVYCGYIGGSGDDYGEGVAVDSAGCAYVTGYTNSSETTFPETGGPDLSHNGGADAFVAKVSADGASLVYCGYIGGSGADAGKGVAVDDAGCAYVAGHTNSPEASFPITVGPDLYHNGGTDAFVAKVSADGASLAYCGYIGGSGTDYGLDIAVDGGCAYVTGYTDSSAASFPETVGPDLSHNSGRDAFVAKVAANGASLAYCGYIGGSDDDLGLGIAVDSAGCAYVTGNTKSSEGSTTPFPVTAGPDLNHNGGEDVFVAKVAADGTSLVYCGYIGGVGTDGGYGIAVDGDGCAYVTGRTGSSEASFPETGGPDLSHNGGTYDAFVAKVAANGASLVYCGYIGGSGDDHGLDIAVDGGCAYVTGYTDSSAASFPVTDGPDLSQNGGLDAFVAKVAANGASLVYCGYIGGSSDDSGYGIAVDSAGCAYVAGQTYSSEASFPVVGGPDLIHNGSTDAFVAKMPVWPVIAPASAIIAGPTSGLVDTSYVFTATVSPITATTPITYVWQAADQSPVTHVAALTDTIQFSWGTAGAKLITVTAANEAGTVTDNHSIAIYSPPANVGISGPAMGIAQASYTFTATVSPITATTPITYVWQAADQSPVTHVAALTDTIQFSWGTAGAKLITVTAINAGGVVSNTHAIVLDDSTKFCYLPAVMKN